MYSNLPAAILVSGLIQSRLSTTSNIEEVVEGYRKLKKLASSPRHVVPGHDPLVLARYPAAKPGLEGWVVRLDAEPKE